LIPSHVKAQADQNHIKWIIDSELSHLRHRIIKDNLLNVDVEILIQTIIQNVEKKLQPNLKRVINATGIVLHTNLGRAVLSDRSLKHLHETMTHYNTLEYDLELGKRGSRYTHIEELLCRLTGAEAAIVVNNNAAAVMLVLNSLSLGKEVIISRGELVEIGGSFRIPEVMKTSGCKLTEVGTTNKTHLRDFETNINENTGMLLKVHTSNYQILGFTKVVPREELALLSQKHNIPFYEDLGSGALIDLSDFGLKREPLVSECLASGVDILSFSGDKLLGASQAGIIVGRKKYIDQIKQNQLLRALRIDKLSLAVLEDTLLMYLNKSVALDQVPTLSMLTATSEDVLDKVTHFIKKHQKTLDLMGLKYGIEAMDSQVGGGALPLEIIPSYGLCLRGDIQLNHLQYRLRQLEVPIICKIEEETLLLDFRTVFLDDFEFLIAGLETALAGDYDE